MSNNVNNEKTPTTMSYENFLNEQLNIAKNNAENARVSAINTAQGLYSRALSGYGAQGEKYSNMGLKGSGYTQYLDGQAMAQRNAAIANAYRTEADANTAAENAYNTQYQTYLQQQQQGAATAFNNILTNIDQHSLGDIKYLGGQYKMNEDQIKYLVESALKADNYTVADIDDSVKDLIGTDVANTYIEKITNAPIDTSANAFNYYDDGGNIARYTAEYANNLINDFERKGVSSEKIAALRKSYDQVYKPQTVSNLSPANTFGTYADGDKMEIRQTIDGKTTKFNVDSGGKVEDKNVKDVAFDFKPGTVFRYRGEIYFKGVGTDVYKVKARSGSSDYNNLQALFDKNGGTSTGGTASASAS